MGHSSRTKSCGRGVAAALCMLVFAWALLVPQVALGLTTNKATARPNEDGGSSVIGGLPTRLTWEGTVEEGEEDDGYDSGALMIVPENNQLKIKSFKTGEDAERVTYIGNYLYVINSDDGQIISFEL